MGGKNGRQKWEILICPTNRHGVCWPREQDTGFPIPCGRGTLCSRAFSFGGFEAAHDRDSRCDLPERNVQGG
jgi:hypothetical protein